jgi:DNA-binding CsgD family transcriptional regulator/tetratricopeptide (TPR) repeat protein
VGLSVRLHRQVAAIADTRPSGDGSAALRGRGREQEALDRLLARLQSGQGGALVVRGEAGIGKTALLDYFAERVAGCVVARAAGFQAEMELAYAGVQQLFGSMLDPLERLPDPQRDAIEVAFGLRTASPPDRFLVGVAVLGLLAELAKAQPLVCVIDDAQWLDRASAQTLAFAARRLAGEPVVLVFAVREPAEDNTFDGLPELVVRGLGDKDARELLGSVISGRLDERVADRIVAEARGNPLALMELPHGLSAGELAGGFGVPGTVPLTARVEQSFARRLGDLPEETQRLLLLASAEPVGDPALLLQAAEALGLGLEAAAPAEAAGLLELGAHVRFRHPLVRSAVYGAAPLALRQVVHRALADATDARVDPDRRAWHRALAASGPDEDVANELERSAERAQARGGMAAAAAFLERSAALTPDRGRRARRALAAARANQLAGAPEAALRLLERAADGPLDEPHEASAQHLRGRIALHRGRSAEAAPLLLDAARRLGPLDPVLARDVHLEALYAANVAGRFGPGMGDAARAARAAPPAPLPPRPIDLLLDGLAVRFTEGYSAGAPILKRALAALLAEDGRHVVDIRWPWLAVRAAVDLFEDETWHVFATRRVQFIRDTGALTVLPILLTYLADLRVLEGNLDTATALVDEAASIIDVTGGRRIFGGSLLAACRGDGVSEELIAAAEREASGRGEGIVVTYAEHARAVLNNGLGRYDAALEAAKRATAQDDLGVSGRALAELVEAAMRSGNPELAADALQRLGEQTRVAGSDWALGTEARSRALLTDGDIAERWYREAIERLGRCRLAFELARAHLVYGEWLRRDRRRADARRQLRRAQEMFTAMGAAAFAERSGRELLATGETARKRTVETGDELTPHELRVARLARAGASNQEIATQLFVSPKTVEYHLHRVFLKLGIGTRKDLDRVLPRG